MLVQNHRLLVNQTAVKFVPSPNIDQAPMQKPLFVVIHYTQGISLSAAVGWLTNRTSQVSSHLVISRSGEIVQLVPFNTVAWHAGASAWKGYTNLNNYAIGIELDNAGMMKRSGSQWLSAFGAIYPQSDVIAAEHKNAPGVTYGWHKYTDAQLQATAKAVAALIRAYGDLEIVGHDEIAPKRKWDPGPAFPMEKFRQEVATLVSNPPDSDDVVVEPTKPQGIRYQVENLESGQTSTYTWSTALKPATLLPVPYVSQLGSGAETHKNDCGAASAIMLMRAYQPDLKITPDEFYTRFAIPGVDPYLSVSQLRNALGALGLLTDYKANLTMQDLFTCLSAGKPAIVLLRYKVFEDAGLTEKHFEGPHFAVAVGMDIRNMYLHDPLYTDPANGEAHAYPLELFWRAWKEVASDPVIRNPERSAIIPTAGIGFKMTRKVKVNISALNVRAAGTLTAAIVKVLKIGEVIEIVREMGGWGEIEGVGWIYLAYTLPVT